MGVTCITNFVVAVALLIVTAPFDPQRRVNHLWSCTWAWVYTVVVPGWRISASGRHRIDRRKAYVLVANHTSLADIVLCFTIFRQFKWVSKEAVFKVPFLGWNMRICRYVPLRRGDAESIAIMLEACRRWLRAGMSIMMFPEGTRSPDGRVKPFKHGAFTLALETNLSVIPVAIHGGHALIPKHGHSFATRAELHVEVLDPMPPDGYPDAGAFGEAVRQRIIEALEARAGAGRGLGALSSRGR